MLVCISYKHEVVAPWNDKLLNKAVLVLAARLQPPLSLTVKVVQFQFVFLILFMIFKPTSSDFVSDLIVLFLLMIKGAVCNFFTVS